MYHQGAPAAWRLQCRFASLTALCVLFIVAWISFWPGGYKIGAKLLPLDWAFGRSPDQEAALFNKSFSRPVSNWTAFYTRAHRAGMPSQPVPRLAGNFTPKCSLRAPCISVGSGWFGDYKSWEYFGKEFFPVGCPYRCELVSDVSEADAIVFNGRDLPARPPAWKRHPMQVWVYLNLESPRATQALGLNVGALPVYHTLFNMTATYQSGSPARTVYGFIDARPQPIASPQMPDLRLKKRLAYIVFSNCWGTFNSRPQVVRRLQAVMDIDVFGGCGKLKLPRSDDAFKLLGKQYYFYFSFENAFCRDYITEKFFGNALTTDAVPVAIGGMSRRDYESVAPSDSFVYGPDFATARELADHLKRLAADSKAYLAMFAWRARYLVKSDNLLCGTCRAMYAAAAQVGVKNSTEPSSSSSNSSGPVVTAHLADYYSIEKNCRPANFQYLV